jgi:peptide/nickel transport system permease protein
MKSFFRFCLQRPLILFGYGFIALLVFLGIFADLIAMYPATAADPTNVLSSPSWSNLFGTDVSGMDVFSRTIYAIRLDLAIALVGTAISAIAGTFAGAFIGFYEGKGGIAGAFSMVSMRVMDVMQSFPIFVFAIALVAIFGQGIYSIIIAIAFVNAPIYLRLMRGQVLAMRNLRYVEASFIAGIPEYKIIIGHIMPNSMGPILSQLSVNIGWSILLTAALSFAGAGVVAPTAEWGSMIAVGFSNVVTGQWWPSIFPGVFLALTVFSFGIIGSSVEILADPIRRRVAYLG